MSVRVRFAPSPTGFLHIGNVHTALFNWLFARHEGGEFRLRIENTDTSREVEEATGQIQDSLSWLGLDWDGEVTFQLDRMEHCREEAQRLLAEGKAYEDEGAIRMRMPDEGVTAWDDLIRGRIEVPSEKLEDLVLVRADGRPTYNFASPVEDWLDEITHVLRGDDHISNTPKQIRILEALGAPVPQYGHLANILGPDGKKLSKRHGAVGVDEFRAEGYIPEAIVNYLALLGWSYDDKTEIMTVPELIEWFTLEGVGPRAAVHCGSDPGRLASGGGPPGAEAASGIPADPRRRDRIEGVAGSVREHRAARAGDRARAAQCGRRPLIGSGFGGASGSSARWNSRHERCRNCWEGRGMFISDGSSDASSRPRPVSRSAG